MAKKVNLRDQLKALKNKLNTLEDDFTTQLIEVSQRSEVWYKRDEEISNILKNDNPTVVLNVGGQIFQTKLETLLQIKDTMFYRLILSKQLDYKREIFIDRNYQNFKYIISYLRNKKLNTDKFTSKLMDEINDEAKFYEITELVELLDETKREITFIKFECNGQYSTAGTHKLEDITNYEDKSMMKGICVNSPGWIIFELNREADFEEIEVGGWKGNSGLWSSSNGSASTILTSCDKNTWTTIGTIPTNFGNAICKVNCLNARGRYIKLQSTGYLGVGYFRVLRKAGQA
jgi:hypothetical protein